MSKDIDQIKNRMMEIHSKIQKHFSEKANTFLNSEIHIDVTDLETLKEEYMLLQRLEDIHHSCDQVARGRMSVEAFASHYMIS